MRTVALRTLLLGFGSALAIGVAHGQETPVAPAADQGDVVVVQGRRLSEADEAVGLDQASNVVAVTREALLAGLDASGWACDDHFGVGGAGRMRLGVLDLVPVGPSVLQCTRQLLAHRRCHVAVLMVDPDEVATLGLPVDRCALAIAWPVAPRSLEVAIRST